MSRARARTRPLRLVTYNILLGGARREEHITAVLRRLEADVVALQEVSNPEFAEQLARDLGMELILGAASDGTGLNIAILSRLQVKRSHNHLHEGRMLRSHLVAVLQTGGHDVPEMRLHCLHLAARFGERNKGEARRKRELDAVFSDLSEAAEMPHLIAGDFNSLAPGERVEATAFFARMAELRRARAIVRQPSGLVTARSADGDEDATQAWLRAGVDPRMDVGIPTLPFVVFPLTSILPRSAALDRLIGQTIERWTVPRMVDAGYTDCFRHLHPRATGYTCATWMPAARIDYVWADPAMATTLRRCEVVGSRRWPDHEALLGSDHHPVVAEFAV